MRAGREELEKRRTREKGNKRKETREKQTREKLQQDKFSVVFRWVQEISTRAKAVEQGFSSLLLDFPLCDSLLSALDQL